uniref:Small ribosomal subunit protein uS3m n=1 Tax=Lactarius hatsudake TaxID=416442 RepID=A0A2Z4M8T7_9AGAM|nr:ribosomal protein S3 [Lactarius hatsudake]AWX52896.1 ribosomal protein S3 [Lactarius hatsudake]
MNQKTNLNIKLSPIYGLSLLKKHINKGITNISVENIIHQYKKIELESKKYVTSKKANKKLQTITEVSDMIINSNKSQLNLLNKNQLNLNLSKSENLNNELTKPILNESKSILMNEQQYIRLLSPFNSKLANYTNHIYTFTNRPYKKINKNLNNIYTICKSAFLNMSSIISKPIVLINPNLIKITLFYYWKPLRKKYYNSNLHSNFFILYCNKLEKLVNLLSKLFKKSVELELIRIYSPQNESNILANLIGILSNFIKFRSIHMKLFKVSKTKNLNKGFNNRFSNNKIPSFLSGIYLKLAGRVLTQKLQRRVKSKIVQKGSLARTTARLINTNRFVNKNKRGTFSITIKTGHIIND